MEEPDSSNFNRIAKAIGYIRENYKSQPSLDEVAGIVNLSSFHFQRMFSDWAGVSPKKFLQYISIEHAKRLLKKKEASLFDVADDIGLSGTGRLHDLFITIEGMTPGEYKNGGQNLVINYSFAGSPFGNLLVASTAKGICHMSFADEEEAAFTFLKSNFKNAVYLNKRDSVQQNALSIFSEDWTHLKQIKLHLKGSEFQLKVWNTLLKIPFGKLKCYGDIAGEINCPKASRAVGSAIGDNPVAYLIPCHRVIQSGGHFGNYHWGCDRKTAMIGWEGAKSNF